MCWLNSVHIVRKVCRSFGLEVTSIMSSANSRLLMVKLFIFTPMLGVFFNSVIMSFR